MNSEIVCTHCNKEAANFFCGGCVKAATLAVTEEERRVAQTLRLLGARQRLRAEISKREKAVQELEKEVELKEQSVHKLKTNLYKKQSQLDNAIKRQQQKPVLIQTSDAMTSSEFSVATLPLLHPFRQLLSVAQALNDERKNKIEEILRIFPNDINDPTTLNTYTSEILVVVSEIVGVPLPFPVAFGSMASSPLLMIPESALVSGTYPVPRLLHPSQKRLVILEGSQTTLAQKLLIDDVIFVAAVFGVAFAAAIDNFTVLTALTSASRAAQFGNPFSAPSMRLAPLESRDDKITDNHEWTVLDSSYFLLCCTHP